MTARWPELPYAAWKDTCTTLQLWTQIVGKTRLALTPWLNHSWHVSFEITARGLGTPLIHAKELSFQVEFDLVEHLLRLNIGDAVARQFALRPMPVAEFHERFFELLSEAGIAVQIVGRPNEVADATPFREDRTHASYDPDYANWFWRVLLASHEIFLRFRTAFLGKSSPIQFFWGSFDLAVTRFSGRRAPLHPGGVPHLPDAVVREAYSHEVSSAGFWPGGGPVDFAAFYSYAYPAPQGFPAAKIRPPEAYFSEPLGEFILPYDALRNASDPDKHLMEFLESTYAAAAELADWDRKALECAVGALGKPRPVS
ncbi:MAG TPA: DUF5996 family protein [Rhizomicrobium sp.]|jgi:hypothetical protein